MEGNTLLKSFFNPTGDSHLRWRGLFLQTCLSAFLYVFMEWLFSVTKPSFMDNLSIFYKFEILFFVGSLAASAAVLATGTLYVLSRPKFIRKIERIIYYIAATIPAGILSALVLILVDNFTYTVFRFGIVSTDGYWRLAYAAGFVITFVLNYRSIFINARKIESVGIMRNSMRIIIPVLAVFIALSLIIPYIRHGNMQMLLSDTESTSAGVQLPNIILITADGLNANHMSLYGYERDTTPFLRELGESALVAQNNFTNSANTSGSITSILTGKHPTTTRVLYPPNILRDYDSYQHLPGILKGYGYSTIQLSLEFYVDAYKLNLLNGFDEVNGRRFSGSQNSDQLNTYFPGESAYFFYETFDRIYDRFRHVFFIQTMVNAYEQVTVGTKYFADFQKMERLTEFLEEKDQPVFAHIHWLGTHGEKFYPDVQVFSAKKSIASQSDWDVDFYDDAILTFDQSIEGFYEKLVQTGEAANTIIVIASDHGQRYVTTERLPLLIYFPNSQYAKQETWNTQNLDIAPTLLDYLGQEKPIWMRGDSLIRDVARQRIIYAVGVGSVKLIDEYFQLDIGSLSPPFYQIGFISIIDCDRWYRLNLINQFSLESQRVNSYSAFCPNASKSDLEILRLMADHLKENQFDTSSLEAWIDNYPSR